MARPGRHHGRRPSRGRERRRVRGRERRRGRRRLRSRVRDWRIVGHSGLATAIELVRRPFGGIAEASFCGVDFIQNAGPHSGVGAGPESTDSGLRSISGGEDRQRIPFRWFDPKQLEVIGFRERRVQPKPLAVRIERGGGHGGLRRTCGRGNASKTIAEALASARIAGACGITMRIASRIGKLRTRNDRCGPSVGQVDSRTRSPVSCVPRPPITRPPLPPVPSPVP
jgi:hypothetical protein